MRKNFGSKPWTYPQTVFIIGSYDEKGQPDAMNAAWCGISDANQIGMCLSPGHKTVKNILANQDFTVSMGTAKYMVECDYLGIASANDVPDKLARCGFHTTKAEHVDAPLFDELPMALECRLISYNEDTRIMLGEIINVCADESILTDGKIDPAKLEPITFDGANNTYIKLGEVVGRAFHDGAKFK